MCSGEAFAPRGRPVHDVLRGGLLPEGEIERRALVVLAVQVAGPFAGIFQVAAREDAVVVLLVVFGHVEVDGTVAFVGIAGIEDLLHERDLLDDMAGGTRLDGGRQHAEAAHRVVVAQGVGLDHLHRLQLLQPGFLGDLVLSRVGIVLQVSHVGDVADVADLVAQLLEQPEEHVVGDARTGVSQVGVAIDRRAADIHAHHTRMDGDKEFLLMRQRIIEVESSGH